MKEERKERRTQKSELKKNPGSFSARMQEYSLRSIRLAQARY